MRVLHTIHSLGHGGIEMWLLSMLKKAQREQAEMDVLCIGPSCGPAAGQAEEAGARVLHCPMGFNHLGFIRRAAKEMQAGKYDLVHNHFDYLSFPIVRAARRAEVPVLTTFHNTTFPAHGGWRWPLLAQLREVYGRAGMAYATSHSTLLSGVSLGVLDACFGKSGPLREQARLLYLGAPSRPRADEAQRARIRQAIGVPETSPLVVHVGRFASAKNHLGLLRIMRLVLQRLPQAKLVLVGDGLLRPSIEKEIKTLGISDSVSMLGRRSDAQDIMAASDCMAMPSFHEGLPIVLMEAYGCGLPVVASDIPGIQDAVQHNVTGLLNQPADEPGFADSISRILTDQALADRLRIAGKAKYESTFSLAASLDRLLALHREAIGIYREKQSSRRLAA